MPESVAATVSVPFLEGIRVIEFGTSIAIGYAGMLLAGLGASVFVTEEATTPDCCPRPLAHLRAGKHVRADREGALDEMDLVLVGDPADRDMGGELMIRHPHLIVAYASVLARSGTERTCPAVALDAYAASGVAWIIGEPGRSPLLVPFDHADFQTGAHLASACVLALIARQRSGAGQMIDITAADVLSANVGTNALLYLMEKIGRYDRAGRRALASGGLYPYVVLPCADGEVCLVGRTRQDWDRLVEAMETPAWTREPRYQDLRAMGRDYPDEVDALIQPWLLRHTRAELLAMGDRYGFPIAPIYRTTEAVASPQLSHRGFFVEHKGVRVPGLPWKIHVALPR